MSYESILAVLLPEPAARVQQFVDSGLLDAEQVALIIQRALMDDRNYLKASDKAAAKHPILLRTVAMQFISMLEFLRWGETKSVDVAGFAELLARLSHGGNSRNARNELLSHMALTLLLPGYQMLPLFGEGPDGVVPGNPTIPVEIKSRYPLIFEQLSQFFEDVVKLFPVATHLGYIFRLHIERVSTLTKEEYALELTSIAAGLPFLERIGALPIEELPKSILLNRKQGAFHYSLEIIVESYPHGFDTVHVPPNDNTGARLHWCLQTVVGQKNMVSPRMIEVTLSEEARQELALVVFRDCLKNAKNMPDQPRVICIHTPHASPQNDFLKDTVEKYIRAHPGTAVVIVNSFGTPEHAHVGVALQQVGADLNLKFEMPIAPPAA